jgi:hypothetical protein
MSGFINFLRLAGSNIRFRLDRFRIKMHGKNIVSADDSLNCFMSIAEHPGFKVANINAVATSILYEGLLVSQGLRKDYSHAVYSLSAKCCEVAPGELTFKVMDHIASSYLKAFSSLDAAFIIDSRRMRYIIKCMPKKVIYLHGESAPGLIDYYPLLLKNKKVMVISDHADLIKIQFIRLKSEGKEPERFAYSMISVDPNLLTKNTDKSLFFESLDSLRMNVLNYAFDVCLIHQDIYSLPLSDFFSRLGISCIIMDDSIFSLFDIVRTKGQIGSNKNSTFLSLEDYDLENSEDFSATAYLAKKPIRNKDDIHHI